MTFPWSDGSDIAFTQVGKPKTQICTLEGQETIFLMDVIDELGPPEVGLTPDEVTRVLRGDYEPLGLTAASEPSEQTGAMIALLPTIADQERLAVPGGEDEEELHLTLFYLGEAAKLPPNTRNYLVNVMAEVARNTPIVDGDGFAISTFNPEKPDKETCVTLGVSGPELAAVYKRVKTYIGEGFAEQELPEQHAPWIPHVTLAYSNDSSLPGQLTNRTGPLRFDVLRVAFAGEVTDFPLYDGSNNTVEEYPVTDEGMAVTADAGDMGEYDGGWIGPLVVEDTDTGDGRMFSGGSLSWADTSEIIHPFQWAPANQGEHKGSVTAGRIDKIWRDTTNPRVIMGKGRFNLNDEDGVRAFNQVKDGFAGGVSIDPDQIADADVELEFESAPENPLEAMQQKPTKTIFHAGRIRGATLVAFPALVEASIKLTKKSDNASIVASASTTQWRAVEHEMRLGEEIDGLTASVAFAHVHDIDDLVHRQQCRFLHHEINEDGSVGLPNLVACAAHIAAINSGRTFGLMDTELREAYAHMAQHFTDAGQNAPAFTLSTPVAVTAAVTAAPPLEWFGNPNLSGPTPVSVTEDGRVFGHAAAWNSCHTGFADTCVSPPMENDYSYFTTGEVLTAEGHRVAVGQITLGTSHAPTRGMSVAKAIDHYGDTGTAVADVTAGVDDHGIWISGAVRPGASVEQLHALRASALSGDWRRIGGNLRMVALLAVNVPGFPIPRLSTNVTSGKQLSLVASGIVEHDAAMSFEAELALLAGACGAPLGKKMKKYATMDEELTALASEIKGE